MQIFYQTGINPSWNFYTLKRPSLYNHKDLFQSHCPAPDLPPVVPQEKAHKYGTSCLPVFKDDLCGMQNSFLLAGLSSPPSRTSGCSSAYSCSALRANTATVLSRSTRYSDHNKETHWVALLAEARHDNNVHYLESGVLIRSFAPIFLQIYFVFCPVYVLLLHYLD